MDAKDILEHFEDIEEYKLLFNTLLDEYGKDLEAVSIRFIKSLARVQAALYKEYTEQGFTESQAMQLLLSTKHNCAEGLKGLKRES